MYQGFIPSYNRVILHCVDTPPLFTHASVDGHWGVFHFFTIINSTAMNAYTFLCTHSTDFRIKFDFKMSQPSLPFWSHREEGKTVLPFLLGFFQSGSEENHVPSPDWRWLACCLWMAVHRGSPAPPLPPSHCH